MTATESWPRGVGAVGISRQPSFPAALDKTMDVMGETFPQRSMAQRLTRWSLAGQIVQFGASLPTVYGYLLTLQLPVG